MAKKHKQRLFSGMSYRQVQRSNSNRRSKLPKQEQQWLKNNGYRNVGWDSVIRLYQKINDILAAPDADEPTLEELFLKADRLGSQYQTPEERQAFNQALQSEAEAIADEIDKQFPDSENEHDVVDYRRQAKQTSPRRVGRKRKS